MKTLIVGFGNPMRSDDGVGPRMAQELDDLKLPETEVRTFQQLNIELADELSDFDRVILLDASEEGPGVELREVDASLAHENISSHFFRPELLLAMTQKIYGHVPKVLVCSVRGEKFDFGSTLSPAVEARAKEAVQRVAAMLKL